MQTASNSSVSRPDRSLHTRTNVEVGNLSVLKIFQTYLQTFRSFKDPWEKSMRILISFNNPEMSLKHLGILTEISANHPNILQKPSKYSRKDAETFLKSFDISPLSFTSYWIIPSTSSTFQNTTPPAPPPSFRTEPRTWPPHVGRVAHWGPSTSEPFNRQAGLILSLSWIH